MLWHQCPYCERTYKCKGSRCENPYLRFCKSCREFFEQVWGGKEALVRQTQYVEAHLMALEREIEEDYSQMFRTTDDKRRADK